jgi:hypothetical protein
MNESENFLYNLENNILVISEDININSDNNNVNPREYNYTEINNNQEIIFINNQEIIFTESVVNNK